MHRTLILSVIFSVFSAIPISGCAETTHRLQAESFSPRQNEPPAQVEAADDDCGSISRLPEKRSCYFKKNLETIDECERIRPMHCMPYREMYVAEKSLSAIESASIRSARKTYASYSEGDAAYLRDLESYAARSNRAWRAYREAQCAVEPFAQGMSRALAEDLSEACRVRMTQARIDEIKALYAPADMEEKRP